MKKSNRKVFLLSSLLLAAGLGLAACGTAENNVFEKNDSYTQANAKTEIPADCVNYVMFAYSTSDFNVVISSKLTLDRKANTYTLYKLAEASAYNDKSVMADTFKGEYEFYGSFKKNDSKSYTLSVPTSGRYNCYYPTVLNYKSVEKQTQGWVSSTDYPTLLTRFNKWYPAKNEAVIDQPVTLDGTSLTYGEVTMPVTSSAAASSSAATSSVAASSSNAATSADSSASSVDSNVIAYSEDSGKTITFKKDYTYTWTYDAYKLSEAGTWSWANYTLTTTTPKGVVSSATVNSEDYHIHLSFVPDVSSQISCTFVITDISKLLAL
jgi:hypothetical protein